MKRLILATLAMAFAIASMTAVADPLRIVRAFSINGRMHVWVDPEDWTNVVGDYKLQSRKSGTEAWQDDRLTASNWWGPGGQPFDGTVCLDTDHNNCRGMMDFRLARSDSDEWTEFTLDCRAPMVGTPLVLGGDHPMQDAFDSMINSYYLINADNLNDRYVGLDFGKKRYISRLSGIMNGGPVVVEGSDSADFANPKTLFYLDAEESSHNHFYEGYLDKPIGVRFIRIRADYYNSSWFSVWEAEFTEAINIASYDTENHLPTITIDPWYSRENGAQLLRSRSENSGFEVVHTFAKGESVWEDDTISELTGTYYYHIARIQESGEPVEFGGDPVAYYFSSEVPIERAFALNGRLNLFIDSFDGKIGNYVMQHQNQITGEWEDYNIELGNNSDVPPLPFDGKLCIRGVSSGLQGVNNFRITYAGSVEWTEFTVDARLPLFGTPYHDGSHRPAKNAFDGLIDMYYLTNDGMANLWPAVEFESPRLIGTVAAIVNNASGAVFEASDDRDFTTVTTLCTLSAEDCSRNTVFVKRLETPVFARYVRLRCTGNDGWYSVWEMEVGELMSVTENKADKMPKITITAALSSEDSVGIYRSKGDAASGYELVHTFAQGETEWVDTTLSETGFTYYYRLGETGDAILSYFLTFAPKVTRAMAFNGRMNIWIEDYLADVNKYVLQYRLTPAGEWTTFSKFDANGSNNYSVDHPFGQSLMTLGTDFRGVIEWRIRYADDEREWFPFTVDFKNVITGAPWTSYGDLNSAVNALDGRVDSYYLAQSGDPSKMNTGIDFGEPTTFSVISWLPNQSHGTFEISDDAFETYETIYTLTGDDNIRTQYHEIVLDQPVTARYLRYRAPADEGIWFSVWELEASAAIGVENIDFETGCPTLILAKRYAEENGAAIFKASKPNGAYQKVGETAAGTYRWTDTTIKTGETYYYRVAALDGKGGYGELSAEHVAGSRFTRLERDPADETTLVNCSVVFDAPNATDSEKESVEKLFDGDMVSHGYLENQNPTIGLDFGLKAKHIAAIQFYCHDDPWYQYQWMRRLAVFGSNDEADPFNNAVQISEALPNDVTADGGFYQKWRAIACDPTESWRYVFVRQVDDTYANDPWRGSIAELRVYGWKDVRKGLMIIVR